MWRILRGLYRWKGWRVEDTAPDLSKYIIVGAPHTSNWDFVFFAGVVRELGIAPSFIGKHSLFKWPLRRFMFDMGGMPVDRSKRGGYVRSVIEAFEEADHMALVIAPEGTRSSNGEWRTGLYHIAHGAGVPIVPAWVDHKTMRGGMGKPLITTGDMRADLMQLVKFYQTVMPDCERFDTLEAMVLALEDNSGG